MSNKQHRILVVDDDPDISMMLKMMLEFKGYAVNTTDNVDEIHRLLKNNHIGLVIMDMLLSGTNGTDICMEIKRNENSRHIPVMMISAHPNALEICLEAGANDFIAKPFDMNEMLEKISKLVK